MMLVCRFFFFKQKTAYEMRISDWSSDVCSSDLGDIRQPRWQRTREPAHDHRLRRPAAVPDPRPARQRAGGAQPAASADAKASTDRHDPRTAHRAGRAAGRSEEHTSELQSLMRISYAVFCLKKKKITHHKLIISRTH